MLPIKARYHYKIACLTYKTLKNKEPKYLLRHLQKNTNQSTILTRSDANPLLLKIPRVRKAIGARSFSVAAPTIYNSLPADVKLAKDFISFKKKLKHHLFITAYDLVNNEITQQFKIIKKKISRTPPVRELHQRL